VIAAILQKPNAHKGETYPLFGPAEMDHEQMASELSEALGRKSFSRTSRSMNIVSL
jgi:NAD(P)H dehydrogenase (quinone)